MNRQGHLGNYVRQREEADGWQAFHSRFMQLANEEEQIEREQRKDRLLRAYCDYKKHAEVLEKGKPGQGFFCLLKVPETGLWTLSDGVNENFQARCRVLAARAGVALASPEGIDPEDFWLHRLFLDLLENNSDQLFAASREGGVILRFCVASATFCARLERKALETKGVEEPGAVPEQEKQSKQCAQPQKPRSTDIIPGQFQGSRYRAPEEAGNGGHAGPPENPYFPNLWSRIKAEIIPERSADTIAGAEVSVKASISTTESNTQEAFIGRAIAARKRMFESLNMPEGVPHANTPVLDAQKSRSLLGIERSDLENLRREVWIKFFDEASLPRAVEVEWEPVLSSRKIPDSSVDLALTFALTKEYEKAISRACAKLADLLATSAVSRISQANFREAIWRECLDFAYQLGQWDIFASWVDRVAGIRWEAPVTADGATDRERLESAVKPRRDFFEQRIGMYSHDWLSATDRAIELRRTVSAAHTVNTSPEIEKQALDLASAQTKAEGVASKSRNAAAGNERESFVQPILDEKGWSTYQLAVEADVDFHTVNDYLKGRTRPNRSTRKQLADALGIAVGRLPK